MPRVNFEQFRNLLQGSLIQIQQNTERDSALGHLTSSKDHQYETSDGEKQDVNKICQPKPMVNSKKYLSLPKKEKLCFTLSGHINITVIAKL